MKFERNNKRMIGVVGEKMDVNFVMEYLSKYGAIFLFIIILLEYMNLPGFPAGIIMPVAGILSANGRLSLLMTLMISLFAGLVGSWILYAVGFYGGELFLTKFMRKFPKQQEKIASLIQWVGSKGCIGIFIAKLIPMIRTLISIPAGVAKMNFMNYTLFSALGIFVWNFIFIGAGYIFGDAVFQYLK